MLEMMLKMTGSILLVVAVVILMYLLNKKTKFGNLNYWVKQIILGVVFGALAVFGTECGVNLDIIVVNVRDAAPLCAGLLFGGPAGIIAGLIGGIERYAAVLWGAGTFTQVACSVSTVLAGVLAAVLRKYLFDNKRPSAAYGFAIGAVMEVFHMLSVFITNMDNVSKAYMIVKLCAGPMIGFTAVGVMLATLSVSFLNTRITGRIKERVRHQKKITKTFQNWLLICVVVALVATCAFSYTLQTQLTKSDTVNLLALNIEDVKKDIDDLSDANLLGKAEMVAGLVDESYYINESHSGKKFYNSKLKAMLNSYRIAEVNLIDDSGIIVASTQPSFVGYDMASGEQSGEFMCLLDGSTTEYVQKYQPISYDASISRKYAGIRLPSGGFIQIGYDADKFQADLASVISGIAVNWHIGENGHVIVCDENFMIASSNQSDTGSSLKSAGIEAGSLLNTGETFIADVYGEKSVCMCEETEGYYIITTMQYEEAYYSRDVFFLVSVFMDVVLFAIVFVLIYILVKYIVVNNIHKINKSLAQIAGGNLNVEVDVRSNEEFTSLSDDINSTVDTLKRYIAEAAARIDKELEFARSIQINSMPNVFPPYPDLHEFEIFATMDTAKEVGGDFYDFFIIGGKKLGFVMADVSGKGIPAALFMMTAKTHIKNTVLAGGELGAIITEVNNHLCENNEADIFVTAFIGVYDFANGGGLTYVNCGHNPPLLKRRHGKYEWLGGKRGFVLAGMEGYEYQANTIEVKTGDKLFLYTDGVTEAQNSEQELFSETRLLDLINTPEVEDADTQTQLKLVKQAVDEFVGDAEQYDDITMMALSFAPHR